MAWAGPSGPSLTSSPPPKHEASMRFDGRLRTPPHVGRSHRVDARGRRRHGAVSPPPTDPMPRISGKRAFLELLRQEGVDVLFGNPGTTELPLMDAFAAGHDIRYVLALQEAAAMAMADGYAQASGRLAVVNLHVAPGLGNAMGMLYDAKMSAAPILVTAGQHDQGFNVTE